MAKSKFSGQLAKMQAAYKKAERPGGGVSTNLTDGKYRAKVLEAELSESGSGGLKIKWVYEVEDGDFAGEKVTSFDNLGTEQNLGFLKSKLARFGYDPDEVDLATELEGILEAIVEGNAVVSIQVKMQADSDFVNVYVNKLLDMDEPGADEGEAKEAEEETEATVEKGSSVMFKPKGAKKAAEMVVIKVDAKSGALTLKDEVGKKHEGVDPDLVELVAEEEEEGEAVDEGEGEAAEEEAVELVKGTAVKVKYQGKSHQGTVVKVDEESETVTVRVPKLNKIVKVGFDEIDVE